MTTEPNRILDKLDKLDDRLNSIDKTLVKQEENLAEHMRRTNILEKKLEPVEDHVKFVKNMGKLIGFLGIIGGIVKLFLG